MKKKYFLFWFIYSVTFVNQIVSAQPGTPCNNHIKHYWNLNESQGSDLQDVINNNNASEHFNTIASPGKIGGSRYFNGSSEVNIPNSSSFNWTANSSFTIEFWMKKPSACSSTSSSDNNVIIGRDDSSTNLHWWVGVSCENAGKISFNLFDVLGNGIELVSNTIVTDGNWHHIVVLRNGITGISAIYIDGVLSNSAFKTYSSGFQSVKNINLGWLNLSGGYHYNGYLDELAIYDTVLTTNKILDHYNLGNGNVYCDQTPTSRIKIMSLGNSMTEGWTDGTLPDEEMRAYRYDLKDLLEGHGINVDFVGSQLTGSAYFSDCQNAGISGTRDQYLARMLTDGYDERWGIQILNPPRNYLEEYNPDIILLDVGTNDVTHETTPWVSGTEKFTDILNTIDAYEVSANKQVTVYLALIINRKQGEALRDKSSEFNTNIKALAQARINAGDHIVLVDLEHDAGFAYTNVDMISTDPQGLHPNNLGYYKIALEWFSKMSEALPVNSYKPEVKLNPIDTGSVNNIYSSKVIAIGHPAPTFSFLSAPAGMTINAQSGNILWTPLSPADYTISVLVSNTFGSDTATWLLHIAGPGFGICNNETFTAQNGTVTDNSGANNYFDGMDCQKLIQPANATSVTLTFTQFNTEAGYDFVRVYNGSTTSAPLIGQYSGTSLPPSITSTGGSMLVRFTTDNGVVAPGWSANYTSSVAGFCTDETFTASSGTVTDNSGSANYLDFMDCQKLIQPANAGSITLTFTQFNTQAGSDIIRVYNGSTTSAPLIGQYSGTTLPPTLTSTGGSMLIRFTTDITIEAPGWSANYTANTGTPCTNETFSAQTGIITDNSGAGNYFDGMDCQKLIQPANATSITLNFTQLSTEAGYDFVRVYNGSTTSAPLLGQYSGTTLPPTLTSTGSTMLIRFTTDNGVVAPGWSANYTANTGTPCINETFTAQTGTITDNSGAGNYFDGMDCQKLIQPTNATTITLNFTQFSTEAGYDFVRVYNGSTTSAPLLGQYSGTTLPPTLTSTGSTMLIRFTTDNGVVAPGWSANYTANNGTPCINESFTTQTGTITDNSGAGNYSDGMDCQKLIQPANVSSITLNFTQFNTEAGYDFVRVYNGSTTSAPLMGQYSGTSLPPTLTSTGGSMLVRFTSDNGVVAPGWSANYTSNSGSPCTNETFTAQTGTVTDNSGAGNYFNGMDCQKLIQPVNATSITLSFTQFNTEAGYDFVRVYNGATTLAPLLGQFSGTNLPSSVTSTGGSMLVRFTTDNGVVAQGWSANYTVNSGSPCINETFTAQSGSITDNSGAGNYFNAMDCQKLIQPGNAASITLNFTQFNTEAGYDFVRVYNGSTTSAPLLGQYSGTSLPSSVTSTGGSMLIRFTTDNGVVAPGWTANYTANTGTPCINESFTAQSGTITDNSGTGNYFDGMDCQKLIQPANAISISLSFTQFNTEAGYDFVRVYNGSTTSAPLLGQFSGTNLPSSVSSTGGTMLVRFTTDGGVVAPGWSAQYTSSSSPAPISKEAPELVSKATNNEIEGLQVVAYPNPVNGILNIKINTLEDQVLTFELINSSGQLIINRKAAISNGHFDMDVSNISKGIYVLKVTSETITEFVRVIKY